MRAPTLVAGGAALVLTICLIGNLRPEPDPREPFELAGDPTWEASRCIAESFAPRPVRFPVFHFPQQGDNALTPAVLREALENGRRMRADPSCAAALLPPEEVPVPWLGLPELIALQAGGSIPEGPALQALLDGLFAVEKDGRHPLRELVSPDLERTPQGWRARGLVSELQLAPREVDEDLELALQARFGEAPEAARAMSFAGLQHAIAGQIAETSPLIGLAVLVMLVVLGLYFRNPRDVAAAGAGLMLLMGALSGLRKLLGFAETQLSAMLPILLLALGVDIAIHSLQRLRATRSAGGNAYLRALRGLAPALLVTTATSAIAFGSNGVARIADLREWGVLAALGMGLSYLALGVVTPALRMLMRPAPRSSARSSRLVRTPFAARHPRLVLAAAVVLLAGAASFLGNLESGFDVEDFLAADLPYVQTVQRVAEVFPNSGEPAELLVHGVLDGAEARTALKALGARLVEEGLAWPKEMAAALAALGDEGPSPWVLRAGGHTVGLRLPVFVYEAGVWSSIAAAKERLEACTATLDGVEGIDSRALTGAPLLRYAYVNALTRTVRAGIPLTLVLCFGLALLVFRELRLALLALAPVLAVSVCLQAGMVLFGFRLNLVTVQVVALAIGLGGDYMLHYLMRFRQLERARPRRPIDALLAETHAETGWALAGSAASTLLGFALLGFAPMPLFASFGKIQSLMVVLSLGAALLLLPAALRLSFRSAPRPLAVAS